MAHYNTYYIDEELYVSVSTILNTEGVDLIRWALRRFGPEKDPMLAYNHFMDTVSGIGTRIHEVLEHDLKKSGKAADLVTDDIANAIGHYLAWKQEHEIEVFASEVQCHHKEWRVAGTCDLVAKIDGELFLLDIKTGSVQAKAFTQMSAYKAFLSSVPKKDRIPGIENARLAVLSVHRDGKPVELISFEDYYKNSDMTEQDDLGIFHCLRFIWARRNLKSRKWKPVIKNMEQLLNPLQDGFKKQFLL